MQGGVRPTNDARVELRRGDAERQLEPLAAGEDVVRLLGNEVGALAAVGDLATRLARLRVLVVGRELVVARATVQPVEAPSAVEDVVCRLRR